MMIRRWVHFFYPETILKNKFEGLIGQKRQLFEVFNRINYSLRANEGSR